MKLALVVVRDVGFIWLYNIPVGKRTNLARALFVFTLNYQTDIDYFTEQKTAIDRSNMSVKSARFPTGKLTYKKDVTDQR